MDDRTKLLFHQIDRALGVSDTLRFDLEAYIAFENISLRSGQRRLKSLKDHTNLVIRKKGDHHYISRNRSFDWPSLLHVDAEYVGLDFSGSDVKNDTKSSKNDTKNDANGAVTTKYGYDQQLIRTSVPDMGASIIYIFIFIDSKIDLRSLDLTINKDGVSFCRFVVFSDDDEDDPPIVNDFSELSGMVAYVCKLNPLLLLPDDIAKIERMFRAGINSDQVYERYSRDKRPNFWYDGHWKGQKNGWPTIADIMGTWEQAAEFHPKPYHSWPPFKTVIEQIETAMIKHRHNGARDAVAELTQSGFGEIIKNIEGGYSHLIRLDRTQMQITVAEAMKKVREEA